MSRIINLRNPYFIKATSSDGARTLQSATCHLYVWRGTIGARPASPTYTLSDVTNALQDFVIFELSELARDFIDATFDGTNRVTEPIYMGVEIMKSYSNSDIVDLEQYLLFGLDGWLRHEDGMQATQNLYLGTPDGGTSGDVGTGADTEVRATITSDIGGSNAGITVQANGSVTFTLVTNPVSGGTIRWFRGDTEISGQTGRTLTVSNFAQADIGAYTARFTSGTTTVTSNSINAGLSLSGTVNRDINSTLGNPLTFGNGIGSVREVTYTYTTAAFEDILASDVTSSTVAPAPWLTPTIVSTTTSGDNTITVVRYTTNAANETGTVRNGRMVVNIRGKGGNFPRPHTDFVRQQTAPALSTVNVSPTSLTSAGGTVTISVSGDAGAQYRLSVNAISPSNWIDDTAINILTGTVGDEHTLTIPAGIAAVRTVNIVAENIANSANRPVSSVITQAATSRFLRVSPLNLAQFDALEGTRNDEQTITVTTNSAFMLTIPESSNFRFVLRSLDPAANFRADTLTTTFRGNLAPNTNDGTFTVSVRQLANTSIQPQSSSVSAFYDNFPEDGVQGTVGLSQAGATPILRFTDTTGVSINSLDVTAGVSRSFRVDTNTAWTLTSTRTGVTTGGNASLSLTSGNGPATVSVTVDEVPNAGTVQLVLADSNGIATNDTLDLNITSANSGPTDLFFSGATSSFINTDYNITTNATTSGGTITFVLQRSTQPDMSGAVTVGTMTGTSSATFTENQSTVDDYYYRFTAQDTNGTHTSAIRQVSVAATPFQNYNLSRTSIEFPAEGGREGVLIGLPTFTPWRAVVTSGTGYSVIPSSGEIGQQNGFTVVATANASATGEVTVTSTNYPGTSAIVSITKTASMIDVRPTTFAVGASGILLPVDVVVGATAQWQASVATGPASIRRGTESFAQRITVTGPDTVEVNIPGFFEDATRTIVITFTQGSARQDLTITQTGQTVGGGRGRGGDGDREREEDRFI